MKWDIFRQFIINTMLDAVFFGTVVPLCACVCEGCYCENSLASVVAKTAGDSPIEDSFDLIDESCALSD